MTKSWEADTNIQYKNTLDVMLNYMRCKESVEDRDISVRDCSMVEFQQRVTDHLSFYDVGLNTQESRESAQRTPNEE